MQKTTAIAHPNITFIKSYSSAGRGFGAPSVMNHIGRTKYDPGNNLLCEISENSKLIHTTICSNNKNDIEKQESKNENLPRKLFKF